MPSVEDTGDCEGCQDTSVFMYPGRWTGCKYIYIQDTGDHVGGQNTSIYIQDTRDRVGGQDTSIYVYISRIPETMQVGRIQVYISRILEIVQVNRIQVIYVSRIPETMQVGRIQVYIYIQDTGDCVGGQDTSIYISRIPGTLYGGQDTSIYIFRIPGTVKEGRSFTFTTASSPASPRLEQQSSRRQLSSCADQLLLVYRSNSCADQQLLVYRTRSINKLRFCIVEIKCDMSKLEIYL